MASGAVEDCASVLEVFMQDAANLPAEISYMMEEIQAKDKEMQKFLTAINARDTTLQKHVKMNGGMQPHSKEAEFIDLVKKNYGLCADLQDQKIVLSEKACVLLERQVKKLDVKIKELQNDGQLSNDPPLPSVFNKKPEAPKPFIDVPSANMPLQAASISALNANAIRVNTQAAAAMRQGVSRQLSQISTTVPSQRTSAPATPASAIQQQRQPDREASVGADSKRRKLNAPVGHLNLPAQPSNLRQSSAGPGTPKPGTPTGGSRAGSIPRSLVGSNAAITKKAGATKKGPPHQQISKLKNKHTKHARLSGVVRKKGQSPSIRGGRGGTAASEEESVVSSGETSETDASQSRSRRGNKKSQVEDVEMGDEEDVDDEDGEDNTRYCVCNQRSYGEMVACENDECPYQWFHTGCLNMKKVPDEDEDWYCPTCRVKPEIIEIMKQKQKKPNKK